MELRQYLSVLKRHKWLIIEATLIVGIVAGLLSSLRTPQYRATARVLLLPNDSTEQLNTSDTTPVRDPARYVSSQIDIIESQTVANAAADTLKRADADRLLSELSVHNGGTSDVLEISATDPDPAAARDVANAFAHAYIDNRKAYAVAGLKQAADQVDAKLSDLEDRIAALDKQIGDGGLQPGATATLVQPAGSGAPAPAQPAVAPTPPAGAGGQPTAQESLKAQRYAAAVQYETLFGRQQELLVDISLKRGDADIIAEAKTPTSPVSPQPKRDGALGAFVGLLLGLGVAFAREQLDDRLRSREEAEEANALPVLAELPVDEESEKKPRHVATAERPTAPLAEAVRSLRTSLRFLRVDEPTKRILVTSPGPEDGKTFVAANLAVAYAQSGLRTILVSADLRRPRVESMFGIDVHHAGLTDAVARLSELVGETHKPAAGNGHANGYALVGFGQPARPNGSPTRVATADLGGHLVTTSVPGLSILPAGVLPPNPSELVGSQRAADLLERLDELADILVIDSPPVLAVTDAVVLGARVDGVVLVNAIGTTRRGAAQRAKEVLDTAGVVVLGVALNRVTKTSSAYYGYSGYYGSASPSSSRRRRQRAAGSNEVSSIPVGSPTR